LPDADPDEFVDSLATRIVSFDKIIVDSLHHSCIEQQAFDPVTLPEAALISGRTVDVEILSDN
jgi:hypothetical protein